MKKSSTFLNMKDLVYLTGEQLVSKAQNYKSFTPRDLLDNIDEYIKDIKDGRVLELFGLRRTGKTTLIFQEINRLLERGISSDNIVYINGSEDTFLIQVIKFLNANLQFKYVFIDEITYFNDFVSSSNVLCDMQFMRKTVLTGSDSLSFLLASSLMFGRYKKISTTFISYDEWVRLKSKTDIFDYIHNGGVLGNNNYNLYMNEAINSNIQASLEKGLFYSSNLYLYGNIRDLIDVYPKIIIKVTEDCTNRFTKLAIKSSFKSMMSMGFNKNNKILLNKEKNSLNKILSEELDLDFKHMDLTKEDIYNLVQMLNSLDFYKEFLIIKSDFNSTVRLYKELQVQPTIRYNQFLQSLDILNKKLNLFGLEKSDFVKEFLLILEGQLIEQVVQLHALYKLSDTYDIFCYQNSNLSAEIDLVIVSKFRRECYLIEVKRSFNRKSEFHRWLLNGEVMRDFKENFHIDYNTKKIIVYNGESKILDKLGIQYMNIDEFLLDFLNNI